MTVHIARIGLTYFPVPKAACSSLKYFLHEVRTGAPYEPSQPKRHIHMDYPAFTLTHVPVRHVRAPLRVAVVRDPVARLVSAYRNRVGRYRELSRSRVGPKLDRFGLDADPDLGKFVDLLEQYQQAVGPIWHHTRPMVDYLGRDTSYFTLICDISEIWRVADFTNALAGTRVELKRFQTEGTQVSVADLTTAQRDKLKRLYADDYRAFGRLLREPA